MSSRTDIDEFIYKQAFPIEQPEEISDQIPIKDRKLETEEYRVDISLLVSKFDGEMEEKMNFPYGKVWEDAELSKSKSNFRSDLIQFIQENKSRLEESNVLYVKPDRKRVD